MMFRSDRRVRPLTDEERSARRRSNMIAVGLVAAVLLLFYGCSVQVRVHVDPAPPSQTNQPAP